ncbi:MAG: sigma-70 family RNA polymerase sigma factor [Firmicutes bacterium]|nr:sigma-70 family RNA polymerase sigma factor [Bacillota bacterium]
MNAVPEDEKLLVSHCQTGDLRAYDELMQRYEKKVYALCFRMVGDRDDAADLAQEAFLKAFRALPSFKGEASFSTWLFRIVTNTCLDERRKRKNNSSVSLDKPWPTEEGELLREVLDNTPGPLAVTLQRELQAEIRSLLNKLSPAQRAVIVMRDLEGFSYEEMATILQVNMGTIKSRLNRARQQLRTLYLQKREQISTQEHLKGKGGLNRDL